MMDRWIFSITQSQVQFFNNPVRYLDFCLHAESENHFLKDKEIWVSLKTNKKEPTVPVTLKEELKTNIFLRCDVPSVKKSLGMENSSEVEIFKKLRNLKDSF